MKKTMFAVLCLAMTAMTTMAKDNNKSHQGHMNQPRHEMVDPVINMEIVGQMGLSDKKVKQIAALKVKKQDEMKALRAQHQPKADMKQRHGKKHHAAQGKQPMAQKNQMAKKAPHRGAHHAQMQAINEKYRKELKDIMGTKTYVAYVEKVNDRLAMHHAHGKHHKGHGHRMHKGQQMHQHQHGQMQHHKPMPQHEPKTKAQQG